MKDLCPIPHRDHARIEKGEIKAACRLRKEEGISIVEGRRHRSETKTHIRQRKLVPNPLAIRNQLEMEV